MSALLQKSGLLERLVAAVESSGWRALALARERNHPFLLRLFRDERDAPVTLRIYIWNCTHGGKKRAEDEYRVQLTGVVPEMAIDATTLLLGWHEGYGVFVGFDMRRHQGQISASPSIQVREEALRRAHTHAFATHDRGNGEIAVCFRPEFLVEYARSWEHLHGVFTADSAEISLLNSVDQIDEQNIAAIGNAERREVVATIRRRYREHDFSKRVLAAYGSACACCGVQLKLVEAAHIVPVFSEKGSDATNNGVALCALHHRAFDLALISFDETYRIQVSSKEMTALEQQRLAGGIGQFREQLRAIITLPADRRDYPDPACISAGRQIRNWQP